MLEGKDSSGRTVLRQCPNHGGCLLAGLENNVLWQVSLKQIDGSVIARSAGTPRARSQYAYFNFASTLLPNFHIFTSWDAADSFLKTNGIQPDTLRYRGQSFSAWDRDRPNGYYMYGESPKNAFMLARDLDSKFNMDQPYRDPVETRTRLKSVIWQASNPFQEISNPQTEGEETLKWDMDQTCDITTATLRASASNPNTTAAALIQCTRAQQRGLAIYHEGHGGSALDIGTGVIIYLANLGWDVLALDMPMVGRNFKPDQDPAQHFSYALNDTGGNLPITNFMIPIRLALNWALSKSSRSQNGLIMIGRSGGGWSSILYAPLDERIEYAVAIAGLLPQSIRLHNNGDDIGDYEGHEPALYSNVPDEHLMIAAGSKGAFFIYNENDPCCLRVHPNEEYFSFIQDSARAFKRKVGFYIDPINTEHSASPNALEAMRMFIDEP